MIFRLLTPILFITILTASCAKPIAPDPDDVTFTSSLVPFAAKDFKEVSPSVLRQRGLLAWLKKDIVFRKPAAAYKAFHYYNVAKAIYKNEFAIDLFENRDLEGRLAQIEGFYALPENDDVYYVMIQLPALKRTAYLIVDRDADQIENVYFLSDLNAVKKLVKKSVWKDPDVDFIPYRDVTGIHIIEGLAKLEILSYETDIKDEADEFCSILLTCRDDQKRVFKTCYVPDSFFEEAPQKRYPEIPKSDWNIILNQEIAKGMSDLGLKLSWGPPLRIETTTYQEKQAERWVYPSDAIILIDHKIVTWVKREKDTPNGASD